MDIAVISNSEPAISQRVCSDVREVDETGMSQDPGHHVSILNTLRAGDKAYFGWSDVSFKLSTKAVGKLKKDPRVLKNLKGTAIPGEVVAIMGSSGCGKTSLLNVRLPPTVSHEDRKRMVDEAIEVLRLERCADSIIGDEMIKGISGGQKRRSSSCSAAIDFSTRSRGSVLA